MAALRNKNVFFHSGVAWNWSPGAPHLRGSCATCAGTSCAGLARMSCAGTSCAGLARMSCADPLVRVLHTSLANDWVVDLHMARSRCLEVAASRYLSSGSLPSFVKLPSMTATNGATNGSAPKWQQRTGKGKGDGQKIAGLARVLRGTCAATCALRFSRFSLSCS